jgi:DNA-binding transcriptional ArsR family regulator
MKVERVPPPVTPPVTLSVRVGIGFEALVGASVLVTRGDHGDRDTWPFQLAGHAALAARVIKLTGDTTGELWRHLLATATDLTGEPDAAAVEGWLGGGDPLRLRRAVVGADVPAWRQVVPTGLLDDAARGRTGAVARLLADRRHYAGQAAAALGVLGPLDPAETQRRLVAAFHLVRAALPARLENELLETQRGFVRERLRPAGADPVAVLDHMAGFEWTPEEGIRRLVVIPQIAAAPDLLLLQHRDARVVGVPVPGHDRPTLAGLGAAFAAVGDEQRLRILQVLSHHQLGVSDVARQLGIAKSTAHHHLGALRRAGLIQLVGQAWRYAYRTRDDAADMLAARLRLLLATPPDLQTNPRANPRANLTDREET